MYLDGMIALGSIARTSSIPVRMFSSAAFVAVVAAVFGGCVVPPEPGPLIEDGPFLVDDEDLRALGDVTYNLTLMDLASGELRLLTNSWARRPHFVDENRILYNQPNQVSELNLQTGESAKVVDGVLGDATKTRVYLVGENLTQYDLDNETFTTIYAPEYPCQLQDHASAAGEAVVFAAWCYGLSGPVSASDYQVFLRSGSNVQEVTRGRSPDLAGDGRLAYAVNDGIRIRDSSGASRLVVESAAEQEFDRPLFLAQGRILFHVVRYGGPPTGIHGTRGAAVGYELRMASIEDGSSTVLLRTRDYSPVHYDVSPDGRVLAMSFVGS